MSERLLAFKAGRAFRREGTNIVEASPTKGAIVLTSGDDGLLHFIWQNRVTYEIEEVSLSSHKLALPVLIVG
jgi:26S proteasome regulatory subunit N13